MQSHRTELERKMQFRAGKDARPTPGTAGDGDDVSASSSDNVEVVVVRVCLFPVAVIVSRVCPSC